jgi:hypothetical protein
VVWSNLVIDIPVSDGGVEQDGGSGPAIDGDLPDGSLDAPSEGGSDATSD